MNKTISAVSKFYENKDGKGYLYDKTGKLLAVFDGEIQESAHLLYVVKEGKLYCILINEDGEYCLENY